MMRTVLICGALMASVAGTTPAFAQGKLAAGTQNMRLAMDLCLRNYRTPASVQQAMANAGFTLIPGADSGSFEFTGPNVSGVVALSPPFCSIQSTDVPLALAEEMGLKLATSLFGETVERGSPERNIATPVQPCEGLHIFATQTVIRITYSAAGNSGECLNDGTSAIQIKM